MKKVSFVLATLILATIVGSIAGALFYRGLKDADRRFVQADTGDIEKQLLLARGLEELAEEAMAAEEVRLRMNSGWKFSERPSYANRIRFLREMEKTNSRLASRMRLLVESAQAYSKATKAGRPEAESFQDIDRIAGLLLENLMAYHRWTHDLDNFSTAAGTGECQTAEVHREIVVQAESVEKIFSWRADFTLFRARIGNEPEMNACR